MKKLLIITFVFLSHIMCMAQESVTLRLNYNKGDKFLTTVSLNQGMGPLGSMDVGATLLMEIVEDKGSEYIAEVRFKRVAMNLMQGGQSMSYDSDMKEEDLSERDKLFGAQVVSLLKTVITMKYDSRGRTELVKIEPDLPSVRQFLNQYKNVVYPEKALKVGDNWTTQEEFQRTKMSMTNTVQKITRDKIFVRTSGIVTGMEGAKVQGIIEIDRKTGTPLKYHNGITMESQGQKVNVALKMDSEILK